MHADTDQLRDRKGTDHTEYSALFSTLILFCTQILTDKSSKCQCKTGDRKESKSLDLHIRTTSGNRHFPKLVYICLDEYICQRNDRVLESCGQTIRNDLAEHIRIQIDPVQMKPKLLRTVKQLHHTEDST